MLRCNANFMLDVNLGHRGGDGRPRVADERMEEMRQMFAADPRLSILRAFTALSMLPTTVHRILRKCLHLFLYKLKNLHLIQQSDREDRLRFAHYSQHHSDGYSEFLSRIVFTDECIFRLNGHVNTQNARIWGTERPTEGNQVPVNSTGIMFWCGISKDRIIGPFEIENGNVTGDTYRNLLIRKVCLTPSNTTLGFVFSKKVLHHTELLE